MNVLSDGTITPDFLGTRDPRDGEPSGSNNDNTLRVGEVQSVIYPDDKDARDGQRFIEYNVMVEYLDGDSSAVTHQIYPNCQLINLFGGVADKFVFTLRGDDSKNRDRNSDAPGLGVGAKVLILCAQGKRNASIIIGGIRDEQDIKDKKAKGHYLQAVFNGLDFSINKNGEFIITRKGPTNVKGNVKEKESITTISLLKNGETKVSSDNVTVTAKKVNLTADNVDVGKDADAYIVRGTPYRQNEDLLFFELSVAARQLQGVCNGLTAVVTAVMAVPVVGIALSPALMPLNSMINISANAFGSIAKAVQTFNNKSNQYISKNHRVK